MIERVWWGGSIIAFIWTVHTMYYFYLIPGTPPPTCKLILIPPIYFFKYLLLVYSKIYFNYKIEITWIIWSKIIYISTFQYSHLFKKNEQSDHVSSQNLQGPEQPSNRNICWFICGKNIKCQLRINTPANYTYCSAAWAMTLL